MTITLFLWLMLGTIVLTISLILLLWREAAPSDKQLRLENEALHLELVELRIELDALKPQHCQWHCPVRKAMKSEIERLTDLIDNS